MHSCLEISMGSWPALCTQIHLGHFTILIHFCFGNKNQTLLSILLANHALFETYFQDEDSQMDTQIEARGSLGNSQPEV